MSEERKAIDYLQLCYDLSTITNESLSKLGIVLNLIEKQQKEIEELKTTKKELTERVLRLESDKFWDNVVSKGKIKAKIEEYDKMINATYEDLTHYADYRRDVCLEIKNVLQSLLEEE